MMKLTVLAKPGARETRVERVDQTTLRVWVRERPEGGKANRAIQAAVAEWLGVPRSRVTLVSGFKGKRKIVEVAS